MCLSATKFILRKINSGVWFIQTFLQKMLYMPNFPHTSSTVIMQIMNQFHTHSQKKQNPAKKFIKSSQIKIAQRRRRWDRAVKAKSVRSSDEGRDRQSWSTRGTIDERARRTIVVLVDRRARLQSRSTRGAIDERARNRNWRGARSTSALVDRQRSLFFLSLSLIWALSLSLSLSLSKNDLNWK